MAKTIVTKEEMLEHHRQMWNWIASKYEEESKQGLSLYNMMTIYCNANDITGIDPCCAYNTMIVNMLGLTNQCQFCPILWGTENKCKASYCTYNHSGLFAKVIDAELLKKYGKIKELALQIANLPEKIDKEHMNCNRGD